VPARPAAPSGQLVLLFDVEPEDRDDEALSAAGPIGAERPTGAVAARDEPSAAQEAEEAPTPAGELEAAPDPAAQWRALLDFERGWSGSLAAKQRAIRDALGLSSARYHQQLDRALELPEALAYDPALVGRLRRVREVRRSKRFARRVEESG
jgi:Protein of unknown function (DUF3263)